MHTIEKHDNLVYPENHVSEDDFEVTKEKILTFVKSLLTAKFPELLKYADFLEQKNLIDAIFTVVKKNPYYKCNYQSLCHQDEKRKRYFTFLVSKILPPDFLQSVNAELVRLQEESLSPDRQSLEESNQSLYHITDDSRLLRIIREGFKKLDEHNFGVKSTGELEKAFGLNGIFCTFGKQYEHVRGELNLIVLPLNLLDKPDTICLEVECSYDLVFGEYGPLFEQLLINSGEMERICAKRVGQLSVEELSTLLVLGLINAFSRVISPNELVPTYETAQEICLNPATIGRPQMIIVEEEPEYFYEEALAAGTDFVNVPMISDEQVITALSQHGFEYQQYCEREKFVEMVNRGVIDPMDWAVNKEYQSEGL